jgi:hypothetical protein
MKHFIKRLKSFFKHVDSKIKTNDKKDKPRLKSGVSAILIILAIIIPVIIVYLFSTKNISSLEKRALMEKSDEVIHYLDYLDVDKLTNDNYILFALSYSLYNNGKAKLSSTQIAEDINNRFNVKVSAEDVKNNGISPLLLDANITYNTTNDVYELNAKTVDVTKIAKTPVNYYMVKKVSKINKKKYDIVYQKYVIDDPFKVLNHYIDQNAQTENYTDINPYRNYVSGSDSVIRFKEAIIKEDLDYFARFDSKIKVTFVVEDDKILIDKVGKCKLC